MLIKKNRHMIKLQFCYIPKDWILLFINFNQHNRFVSLMEIRPLLSCCLLEIFLLLSSFPSLYFSHSTQELSNRLLARRLLQTTPHNTNQQYLIPHNTIRAKLGLPPLTWSKKLADYASWWAHQRQGDCASIHSNSKLWWKPLLGKWQGLETRWCCWSMDCWKKLLQS